MAVRGTNCTGNLYGTAIMPILMWNLQFLSTKCLTTIGKYWLIDIWFKILLFLEWPKLNMQTQCFKDVVCAYMHSCERSIVSKNRNPYSKSILKIVSTVRIGRSSWKSRTLDFWIYIFPTFSNISTTITTINFVLNSTISISKNKSNNFVLIGLKTRSPCNRSMQK